MDNEEDNFLLGGRSSPRRTTRHAQFTSGGGGGGSVLPNQIMFPPGLRTVGPQYTAALEYEDLRRRYQLEVHQEISLCRRLMEEQQHQLLSESEYRNDLYLQRQHDLHELQARQGQQQGLSQLLARDPRVLELYQQQQLQQQQQQQQQQQHRDSALMAYLREDFLLQQRQQQIAQQQQHRQLQEQLSNDSHQEEQEELLSALRAYGNLSGVLPAELASLVSSLRPSEIVSRQDPPSTSLESPMRTEPPPALNSSHAYVEHFLGNSSRQISDNIPGFQDNACHPSEGNSARKKIHGGIREVDGPDAPQAPQDPPHLTEVKTSISSEQPLIILAPLNGIESEPSTAAAIDSEVKDQVCEAAKHIPKCDPPIEKKSKVAPKKKKKTENKKDRIVAAKRSKAKKPSVITGKIGKKTRGKIRRGTDDTTLSIRERSAIGFLASRRPKNTVTNGADARPESKKDSLLKEVGKYPLGKAVDIVFNFQQCVVSESEVQLAKAWSSNGLKGTSLDQVILPEDITFISQGVKFNLPSLPIEPELTEIEMAKMNLASSKNSVVDITTDSTMEISASSKALTILRGDNRDENIHKRILKATKPGKDIWWPSNENIHKERLQQYITHDDVDADVKGDAEVFTLVRAGVKEAEQRLATSNEPGVLEKLPYCKLYDDYCEEKKQNEFMPMFCCQTTEIFPYDVMVCCSVCSTWRHAQCGGHYKHFTAESVDSSSKLFVPICDQCYIEKQLIANNPSGAKRIEQQRIDHLRRCNATNAVMRQFAFAKHSGQCKWPLGSVPISQFSGHIRNVQARHEMAEKQWKEMTSHLGSENSLKPSERQRVRTKALERLVVCIEDAEGAMDRHNMMLFLQNDTSRLHPVGFETPRRNIFDPEDDPVYIDSSHESALQYRKSENKSAKSKQTSHPVATDLVAKSVDITNENLPRDGTDKAVKFFANQRQDCIRQGCNQKCRYDSIFCSDSCGVSTLEADLLKTLKYASKLHPSALRS